MQNKIYSFIGLAMKAGAIVSGEDACERALKSGKLRLIIVAEDASQNTKKKFNDMCIYRQVDIRFYGHKELIGRYIGKDIRAVIGLSDKGFSKKLIELIESTDLQYGGEQIGKI
ncbi:MAG TPA: ribosomal L7Ae/L30e/S12e/Gadd45 family protein [Clostridia bacterium]|nr:ribosomal L7Ae/L30e/S12e/Gadd45 family protein [Clostridia bacterium]